MKRLAKSACWIALLLLLVGLAGRHARGPGAGAYLALTPTVIDATEQQFQAGMATVRQRAERRLEMDRAIQQVRADRLFMDGLRNAAEIDSPETPPDDGE